MQDQTISAAERERILAANQLDFELLRAAQAIATHQDATNFRRRWVAAGRDPSRIRVRPGGLTQRPRESGHAVKGAARRASARSGDSGDDDPGEPEVSCCERCGAELLSPHLPCGLCLLDAGIERRACRICGVDIADRKRNAQTCSPAHKKALQRRRRSGVGSAISFLERRLVEPHPLDDVSQEIRDCLYGNLGLLVAA